LLEPGADDLPIQLALAQLFQDDAAQQDFAARIGLAFPDLPLGQPTRLQSLLAQLQLLQFLLQRRDLFVEFGHAKLRSAAEGA
jgi:hypothetical protein